MRKLIKYLLSGAFLLAAGLQTAWAYALLGPLPPDLGGEPWQIGQIGYALAYTDYNGIPGNPVYLGDIGGPHNIGEEYRRVTPTLYYAYDANWLGYFGLTGTTNADLAFAIMNSLTNVSSYSADMSEFPPESQQYNPTAQSMYLLDLKSVTLHLLVEQLGLTEPERYTWTLHDRFIPPGCPLTTTYLVVQRNFNILDTPFNQVQYSPYVNDLLYSYYISESCRTAAPFPDVVTVPFSTDPTAMQYTAVAANDFDTFGGLQLGGYYTGLTKDDVAGLRYLMSSNNINYESTVAAGGLLLQTNLQAPQLFGPTLPLALLFSQALTNDPNTLQTNYPGITFISVTTNIVNQITTNFALFFADLPPPYTNTVPLSNGVAVYPPGGTVVFTNWSPVQFASTPILLTTLPLTPLLLLAQTLSPAELQAIYPGLLIDTVQTNYFTVEVDTNVFGYYTNQPTMPVFSNSATGLGLPVITTLTNIYFFTNQPGPTIISYDNTSFLTITTLDLATFSDASLTNSPAALLALYPGLQILTFSAFPTILYSTNYVSYLTNYTGAPFGSPPKAVTLPVSTNAYLGTVYTYQFGNVFTNHYYANRLVYTQNIWVTNAGIGAPVGSPFFTVTNYSTKTVHQVSGDFFIIPTNWCGFDFLLSTRQNISPPYADGPTNSVIFQGYNSSGITGTNNTSGGNAFGLTQNTFDIYTNYLIAVRPGICEPVLQFGTNYTTNIVSTYQYDFLNVVTNHFYTNSLVSLFVTNIFLIPGGSPNTLGTNITVTNFYVNLPSGDFYIVPPTWCGYQIQPLLTNYITPTNIVFTNTSFGTGTITNQQYTFVEYLSYTNYTYSIRPGTCEPALESSTNYTTNSIFEYSYDFGNIITNHYFTNGPVLVTTTNIAILTNGLVGMLTNIITTNIFYNGVGGDFYIIPPNFCDFTILSTQSTMVVLTTNTFAATNAPGTPDLGQMYTVTTVSSYTNSTFQIQAGTCSTVPAPPALRRGIERVGFVRANFDSLVGQYFQPLTNYYTMIMITNSQAYTEYYQRVVTAPDILLTASDQAAGGQGIPFNGTVTRSIQYDSSQILTGLHGPGVIHGQSVFNYNKVGTIFDNGPFAETNGFLLGPILISSVNETSAIPSLQWGSYDSSTNDPILYPDGASIVDLANAIVINVSPTTVPAGTNGVPYNGGAGVTFTATGGQPPYVWAAPNISQLVPGLSFNAATQTLSGTPTASGVFNFNIQLTDSVNRVINLSYSIIIH